MRILLTNNTLTFRAGTELYTRDVALRLHELGHDPVCFSLELGEVAAELRAAGVTVTDNLAGIETPDVIHGHHAIESTLAGITFPQTPVISFCHGPKAWQESPCRLPNVVAWVAVDEACRRRLVSEEGIPDKKIQMILNFADTRRFQPRPPLPEKPQRALVFSNGMHEGPQLDAVRAACESSGIALDIVGLGSGMSATSPELILPQYDIVFAKARAAIEAMAAGCAVIQSDWFGAGRFITPGIFDEIRPLNFGYLSMPHPVTADHIKEQISRYNPQDAAIVSSRVRAEAGLDSTMPLLLKLYHEAASAEIPRFNAAQAAGDFLRLTASIAKQCVTLAGWHNESPFLLLRHPLELQKIYSLAVPTIIRLETEKTKAHSRAMRLADERRQMRERWINAREKLAQAKEQIRKLRQKPDDTASWWRSFWKRGNKHSS